MSAPDAGPAPGSGQRWGRVLEVFWAFLRLGLTAFGGPVAHLAYFRTEFVERRAWLDERAYADLMALCQFLPGPASSQVGLALGLQRAGAGGALAAWAGFTLPSAALLIGLALGLSQHAALIPADVLQGVLQGLKLAAVAVVAQAVWGMSRTLCPDRPRAALAVAAALLTLALPGAWAQVGAMLACGLLGRWLLRLPAAPPSTALAAGVSRRSGALALALCAAGLLGLPLLAAAQGGALWPLLDSFFRAGALVSGGGHVVLPLLQAELVPAAVSADAFLAGYGATQAVPGPLFTFAAYLGAVMPGPDGAPWGLAGGLLALLAIFVPAALLVVGALPFWDLLRRHPGVQSAVAGVNAGVVGLLLAALYDPVWTGAVSGRADVALALAAFALLVLARWSPLWVVLLAALAGGLLGR